MQELGFRSVQSSLAGQFKATKPPQNRKNRQPYRRVYFVRHLDTGAIKIGKSVNPERRLDTLKTMFGGRMELLGHIVGESGETTLHLLLDRWALGKEWFQPSEQVLDVVNRCLEKGLAHGVELATLYSFDE
jgi:hypothetical protein